MTESRVAVIGLGNILLQDEGVGVHIVNALKERYVFNPEIDIIDGGTSGTDLLPYFEDNDRLLIVDAVNFDQNPGFIGIIENEAILQQINSKLSSHHLGLADMLSSAQLLNIKPDEICLFGIQPCAIDVGLEITDTLSESFDRLIRLILKKLEEWGIKYRLIH